MVDPNRDVLHGAVGSRTPSIRLSRSGSRGGRCAAFFTGLATLLGVTLAVSLVVVIRRRSPTRGYFVGAESLLTEAELNFKRHLEAVIPATAQVMAKIALMAVVRIEGAAPSEFLRLTNQVKFEHVDFAVSDRRTGKVLWIIELRGKTHECARRVRRDNLVRQIMQQACVPYLEFKTQRTYDERVLRARISGKPNAPMLRLVTA